MTPTWQNQLVVGEWRFTPQTLKTIDALYDKFEDVAILAELREAGVKEQLSFGMWLRKQMNAPLRQEYFGLEAWQWLALVVLLVVGVVLKAVATWAVTTAFVVYLRHRKFPIAREVQKRALSSSGSLAMFLLWYFAVQKLQLPEGMVSFVVRATQLGVAVTTVWFGYRLVDVLGGHIATNKEIRLTQFDEVLVPMLRKVLRVLVVVVVLVLVFRWIAPDKPLTTVFGALGIGGLAVAFAAKETLGNFIGSLTVLFDRPFGIGDWIVVGGGGRHRRAGGLSVDPGARPSTTR